MRIAMVSFTSRAQLAELPARHWLSSARLAAYLASVEPRWDIRLRSFDDGVDVDEVVGALAVEEFDVVGLPAYIWTLRWSREVAAGLTALPGGPLVVVGGPETRAMDYRAWAAGAVFVMGQGEYPLLDICRRREADPGFTGETLTVDSDGVDENTYSHSRARELVMRFGPPGERQRVLPHGVELFGDRFTEMLAGDEEDGDFCWFETARGCIYACSFCGHNTLPYFATFDMDFLEREIRNLVRRGIRRTFLVDPILGGKAARGKEILRLFQRVAPEIALSAYMRPEFLDDEFVDILADANIDELLMGLQTTNASVPKHVRSNNLGKIMKLVPNLASRGVPWRAELIAGLPGDTMEGLRESLRFAIDELRPTAVHVYRLTAIPETKLYDLLDKLDEEFWLTADRELRVTGSNSYSGDELDQMLAYAGAVMSRYSHAMRSLPPQARAFEAIEAAVADLFDRRGDVSRRLFRELDMAAGEQVWRQDDAGRARASIG